ncbi:CDP-diacylglycerol--serine O-phosphatidyltransferase [Wielerella bovis]|uniref:CDP-diacylglycerol--serine O-phosphatidyltransferase n=1 Tax=Wielerella bovis TaxID=2917790 RepID=UPI002019F4BF|nr:CDP-diacylglycerol--serine O-phosphatidyltransferase [Wielerella bovis]MCG7657834.1 CDP-diacylglycerol--serine O-phosphatidyltransferase [Wielerella bovis]MCG7660056.1 CDP-diacylglycerol--serine O-phosphatidyltransferase [Wielerella bovis]ULJ64467.1 CDP-diacylglycerol--serine O-phosphatidyltransferase [Wielerella bovis]ULJ66745.1 CDP-diacylglycerol--serine O-phosphatidyltransferase [Wielerella bovis]
MKTQEETDIISPEKLDKLEAQHSSDSTEPDNHVKPSKRELIRQNSIYLLPNSFTIAALFAAFFAITQSMHGRYESAAISVFIAMFLDGMDGRVARLTNSQSAFGEQLDSLADMVSFGIAPALIVYNWQLFNFGKLGYCVAFIYCACAALRLALFNTLIGKVDKKWFIGIPSPTAAALMVGMIWLDRSYDGLFDETGSILVLLLTLFAGLSMVVQIPFWSFKELNIRRRVSFVGMIGLLMAFVLLVLQPALLLFLFFFGYSLSGYAMWAWKKWGTSGSLKTQPAVENVSNIENPTPDSEQK